MTGLSGQITALAVHPTKDAIVAVGTASGAYLSTDNGQTFAAIYTKQPVSTLAFTDNGDLLVGTAKADLVSINLETKQLVTVKTPVKTGDVIAYVSGSPANPKEMAIATGNKDVYLSTDNGTAWRKIADQGLAINQP
jgi:photosystem II stability/assembly factor-like uncharacterized protein